MIAYDRYAELLGKVIHKTIAPAEFPAQRPVNAPARKLISY